MAAMPSIILPQLQLYSFAIEQNHRCLEFHFLLVDKRKSMYLKLLENLIFTDVRVADQQKSQRVIIEWRTAGSLSTSFGLSVVVGPVCPSGRGGSSGSSGGVYEVLL